MKPLVVTGVLSNKAPFSFQKGGFIEDYPLGRHIRGALGYIAKDMGLRISEIFPKLQDPSIIFRDCLPLCPKHSPDPLRRKGMFLPQGAGPTRYICPECKAVYSPLRTGVIRTRLDRRLGRVNDFFTFKALYRHEKFRFLLILTAEEYTEDIFAILGFVQEYGLNLGKRHDKGFGRFELKDVRSTFLDYTPEEERAKTVKIRLISDAILKDGNGFNKFNLTPEILKKSVRDACHHYGISFKDGLDFRPLSATLGPPVKISLLNFHEESKKVAFVGVSGLSRGNEFLFETKGTGLNLLNLLSSGYGIGGYIGLGAGEVMVEFGA